MKKTKDKTKKSKPAKNSLFGGATKSLKKLGKAKAIGKLSTTQKVVGGAALVALGLGYLAKRRKSGPIASPDVATSTTSDAAAAEQNLAALDGNA